MNIWIPYNTQGIGGPYTFVRLFSDYLRTHGHYVSSNPPKMYDVLFVIADCPLRYILQAKLAKKPIIQRLDGVYYPALKGLKGKLYWYKNLKMQLIYRWYADHVIYQSKSCQQTCEQILGRRRGPSSLIYNGVAVNAKGIKAKKDTALQLVVFGKFRRTDQLDPILKAVKNLSIPFQLHIYGPYTNKIANTINSLSSTAGIEYRGQKSSAELLSILPNYDIFLFSDLSCCPNAILEAQAAGLAVVTYDRGGAGELIAHQQSGIIVPLADKTPLQRQYRFSNEDAVRYAEAIETIAQNITAFKNAAIKQVKDSFVFNDIAQKYEEVLRSYA